MRRLWPQSLLGQLMLVIALALAVAQVINFVLLFQASERIRHAEAAGPVVVRVAELAGGRQVSARRGPQFDRRGPAPFERRGGRFRLAEASAVSRTGIERSPDHEARLGQILANAGIAVRTVEMGRVSRNRSPGFRRAARPLRRPPELFRVSVELEDGRWVNGWMRLRPRELGALGAIIVQSLVLYLIVLAALFWFARRLSRPLRALTGSVERFEGDGQSAPLAPEGPRDVARLIDAHNAMRERIAAMLGEKDHMLGAIGHDLRTPLAALRIRAENVDDEAERARMVETIEDMSATLDDILSLARLGRSAEAMQPLDLAALVDSAIDDFRDLGADVAFEEPERIVVNGRANLLKRALRNLIDNAVRYGRRALVRLRSEDGRAIVEIDDDGPGIPGDRIAAMFEPFTRLDESRGSATGGSGLGLALARAIVRDHGGEVSLQNRERGGLRARLAIPLASA